MCGIMGYIGDENAVPIIISGLENLEYRGYDSAGLAVNDNDNLQIIKAVGSPSELWKKSESLFGNIGIGHTRWATHGAPTQANAHPHTSQNRLFTVVHNGIIENYSQLKQSLVDEGYCFFSDTDTEVVAQLLQKYYDGDLKGTVAKVISLLEGSYALGIFCRDFKDTLVCVKYSSPLFAGIGDGCVYLASDIGAISETSNRIFRLNDGEIGILKKDEIRIFDNDGCRIRKSEVKIHSKGEKSDKSGYEHYMMKEINEQPDAIRRTLTEILADDKIRFKMFKISENEARSINRIIFTACGSAYHAGEVGAYVSEKILDCPSQAVIASEFRYKYSHLDANTLVVIISQSGETADTLAALRIAKEKGAKTVSIINVENSTIAQESDGIILTKAGREIAVATTKAYSAQLAVIYSLIFYLAKLSKKLSKIEYENYISELKSIPEKIEKILSEKDNYKDFADKICNSDYICFIGRSLDYCVAMEASLKLKEISYIPCEAYAAGELKHGTISLIDSRSLVIALCCYSKTKQKTLSNVNEAAARGASTITISTDDCDILLPTVDDILVPMLEVIPMQLLAYYSAHQKGCEIDKPRNLAKSVTVE